MNDVNHYLNPAEEKMELAVEYLDEALAHIRAGKANPKILDGIRVDYYGSAAPISNVANISVPDARTIAITPWEKSMFKVIEKAIINSELGITPENNGEVIRISIPPLTEERRKALVKQSKNEAEQAKISVRNARRDAIEGLKKAIKDGMPEDVEKDAEAKVQKIHDRYMKRIDEVFAAKEKKFSRCNSIRTGCGFIEAYQPAEIYPLLLPQVHGKGLLLWCVETENDAETPVLVASA